MMNIKEIISLALQEDIGDGDHTSISCVPEKTRGRAKMIAKEKGVVAGIDTASFVFKLVDREIDVVNYMKDGQEVNPGDVILEVSGKSRSILIAERVALNFIQRMSGIATKTAYYVSLIKGTGAKLLDTRKTTPNFRMLEKMAVRIGGGYNHRMGLYDMIMIKDNHVDFAGGISSAVERTLKYIKDKNLDIKIEVETRNMKEVKEALETNSVHRIMLDNFSPQKLKEAVDYINKRAETEASGGITEANIRDYALTGVDYISVGALTHHIKSLDISLKAMF
ncbi:MAG: carboxylating nicotinate-nucleotide diphosphorylase [Bacteroidetes bacterium]|nr:carboxylating nicotinate-nucleotide diphosphorylase [Bacteroidota bacterium]